MPVLRSKIACHAMKTGSKTGDVVKETGSNISGIKAKGMLFITAVIWGSGFIAVQLALDAGLSPAAIVLGRFSIATVLVFIVFFKDIIRGLHISQLKSGIIIGIFLYFAFFVQTLGLEHSTPSNNAFITAVNVVMVPFLWWAVSRRRPPAIFFFASVLCLFGVGLLSVDFSNGLSFGYGDLLTLLGAFLFACQITATGVFAAKMDYRVLVFLQFAVTTVCAFAAFLIMDGDFTAFKPDQGTAAILYLSIFSTSLCYFFQTKAQTHVTSSTAAIILSTEALFGSIFSVLAGYDKLTLRLVAGGIIIFMSVILPDIFIKMKNRPAPLHNDSGL